jgi:hypothetical protein
MASTTPPWPSLYNPSIEILHIEHHDPVQPGAAYLSRAKGASFPAHFHRHLLT